MFSILVFIIQGYCFANILKKGRYSFAIIELFVAIFSEANKICLQ